MVERLVRNQQVRGSNPLGSTSLRSEQRGGRRLPRRSEAKAGHRETTTNKMLRATTRQASFLKRSEDEGCRAARPPALATRKREVRRRAGTTHCQRATARQASKMKFIYVYILQSNAKAGGFYVGFTEDLQARLKKHNAGEVPHMVKSRPWRIKTAIAFTEQERAIEFERYLKSSSGRTFAKKRL